VLHVLVAAAIGAIIWARLSCTFSSRAHRSGAALRGHPPAAVRREALGPLRHGRSHSQQGAIGAETGQPHLIVLQYLRPCVVHRQRASMAQTSRNSRPTCERPGGGKAFSYRRLSDTQASLRTLPKGGDAKDNVDMD